MVSQLPEGGRTEVGYRHLGPGARPLRAQRTVELVPWAVVGVWAVVVVGAGVVVVLGAAGAAATEATDPPWGRPTVWKRITPSATPTTTRATPRPTRTDWESWCDSPPPRSSPPLMARAAHPPTSPRSGPGGGGHDAVGAGGRPAGRRPLPRSIRGAD